MTTQTVKMFAPIGLGGLIQAPNGTYNVAADGTVTANAADAQYLFSLGFEFAVTDHRFWSTPGAPAAAAANVTVSSVALTNGTLTIAAQPDVPRQLQVVVFGGSTVGLTAGSLAMVYAANDGTTQTDNLSLVGGTSTSTLSMTTSKGVERLTSATVSGVAGGTSPGIEIGTNNYIALPVPQRFTDFALTSEKKVTPTVGSLGLSVPSDDVLPTTVLSAGALVAPTTAPDGTHWLAFGYDVTYPA